MKPVMSKPRVFISYTNRDGLGKSFAGQLKKSLVDAGYEDVYYFDHSSTDSYGILLWEDAGLPSEIKKRDVLVLVCTTAIRSSRPAIREFNLALILEKMVVPLQYDAAGLPLALLPEFGDTFDETNCDRIFELVAEKLPISYSKFQEIQILRQEAVAALQISPEKDELKPRQGELGPK